jgi:hypothetical protein
MDSITKLQKALHLRMYGNPDDYYEESVWKEEIDTICEDLPAAIRFILSGCSDEEIQWLSEVFDDVMEKTRSLDFLNCIRQRVQAVKDDGRRAELLEDIKTAEEYIGEPTKK